MLSTRSFRELIKDKYNWIAAGIGAVLLAANAMKNRKENKGGFYLARIISEVRSTNNRYVQMLILYTYKLITNLYSF